MRKKKLRNSLKFESTKTYNVFAQIHILLILKPKEAVQVCDRKLGTYN